MPEPPPPDDATRIEELVEAVNGHARSLVLLAPEISARGVVTTTATLSRLMAKLQADHPDDRERSLFASVELSLGRLTPEMRRMLRPLGVFQGEVDLDVLAMMLGQEPQELFPMARALLETNLAELMPYDHLRLHPALCPYLALELTAEETAHLADRWADGMRQLTIFLYNQQFKDAQLSATLTRLELPNLLHLLEYLTDQADAETTLAVATSVEQLLANLDHPRLLRRVVAIREQASQGLGGGLTHARFTARRMEIERLLQAGQLPQAHQAAQQLLADSQGPGSQASAYNQAMALWLLGWALRTGGAAEEALSRFREAQRRFERLGEEGARMASVVIAQQGDCLRGLGRLDEAAQAYEQAVKRAEAVQDTRQVAVGQGNLAWVWMDQGRYAEALAAYEAARQTFAELGEPQSVATAWHQIGRVHEKAGNYEAAEEAYREALASWVQQKNRTNEASTLDQLGILYDMMNRLEESVTFHRQAADIRYQLQDQAAEGRSRNNLAIRLIKLRRYDEARAEIRRAIECKRPYGHAATPWTSWNVLHDLERAVGDQAAAERAKAEARRLFLAYRRDGGENHSAGGRLCAAFTQALQAGQTGEMAALLRQLAGDPGWQVDQAKALASTLQAVLRGSRDPALAENSALSYDFAAEVQLLLETLGG
jgi:tetratricopeptide (TPR) repeat protein